MNLLHDGASALSPNPESFVGRLVFVVAFDPVERRDEPEHFFAWLREALLDLDKLASHMRPAMRELEVVPTFLQRLIRAVAVTHHRAGKRPKQLRGRVGATARVKLVEHRIPSAYA